MKKRRISADELTAKLMADPEWVAERAKEEEARQRRGAHLTRAEAPLE